MPVGSEMPEEIQLIKLLLIGNSKVGKTHYAVSAARAGFNVLYIDGDVSRPTIRQFPPDALKRLFYLQFNDVVADSGMYIPKYALLVKRLLSQGVFSWDDTANRLFVEDDSSNGHARVDLNVAKLNSNWVIVFDSWTAISHSIMSAMALNANVDLSEMDKAGQSIYGSANNFATDILSRIRSLQCHTIVIAHPDEYTKYKVKPGNLKDAQRTENREIEYARMIPKSVSRPHGMSLASYFTDVAWLEINVADKRIINFETTKDREGGGRFSGKYPVDEVGFSELVKRAGGSIPVNLQIAGDPALTITPSWERPAGVAQSTVMNPNAGSAAAKVSLGVSPNPGVSPVKLNLGKR